MNLPSGLHKNLLPEQYIATDRINNSDFKVIDKSLLHYKKSQALPKKTRDNLQNPYQKFWVNKYFPMKAPYLVFFNN